MLNPLLDFLDQPFLVWGFIWIWIQMKSQVFEALHNGFDFKGKDNERSIKLCPREAMAGNGWFVRIYTHPS